MIKVSKKEKREKVISLTFFGAILFAFGLFIGYQINYGSISKIQGYLFNAVGDATDSNATDSNATDSNATDSNATDSNATDSDYDCYEDIYLDYFSFKTSEAKPGDKVYVNIGTLGADYYSSTVYLKNDVDGNNFAAPIFYSSEGYYFTIPNDVTVATYKIESLLLFAYDYCGDDLLTKYYTPSYTYYSDQYDFNSNLNISAKETNVDSSSNDNSATKELKLESFLLDSKNVKKGDKVNFSYKANTPLNSIKLSFKSEDNKIMNVYASSLSKDSYFEIPSNVSDGKYTLYSVTIGNSSSYKIYSTDLELKYSTFFDFKTIIDINSNTDKDKLVYNNEDINETIINNIFNSNDINEIVINADNNSVISSNLFDAIKGSNKKIIINYKDNQIIFDGKNIQSAKTIDVSVTSTIIKSTTEIGNLVSDGIVVNFQSNGNLPGKAKVRIKATEAMENTLKDDKVYVYYYNNSKSNFTLVASAISKTSDGYYEFNINHNSDYIFVNKKLDSKLLSAKDDNVVNFQKSNKLNLILIILGLMLVIVVVIIILLYKYKLLFFKNRKDKEDKK